MKRVVCILLSALLLFSLASCQKDTEKKEETTTAEDTTVMPNTNGYVLQPENAMQKLIPGMMLCYLDYYVQTDDYLAAMTDPIAPTIINTPSEFTQFFKIFTYTDDNGETISRAKPLYDEMCRTEQGKMLYTAEEFYNTWSLIVFSVRESSKQTTHEISSVTFDSEGSTLHMTGTRAVSATEDGGTVRQIVLRVPANHYLGARATFTVAE